MKFRKKPIEVEAIQFTGHNDKECLEFCPAAVDPDVTYTTLVIKTLEGDMVATPRCWIVKGVKGEFYPVQPDIFEATYEPVDDQRSGLYRPYHPSVEHILQFFNYYHLPVKLQEISKHFHHLAFRTARLAPDSPETTVALRKLLEAKDAAVRSTL